MCMDGHKAGWERARRTKESECLCLWCVYEWDNCSKISLWFMLNRIPTVFTEALQFSVNCLVFLPVFFIAHFSCLSLASSSSVWRVYLAEKQSNKQQHALLRNISTLWVNNECEVEIPTRTSLCVSLSLAALQKAAAAAAKISIKFICLLINYRRQENKHYMPRSHPPIRLQAYVLTLY